MNKKLMNGKYHVLTSSKTKHTIPGSKLVGFQYLIELNPVVNLIGFGLIFTLQDLEEVHLGVAFLRLAFKSTFLFSAFVSCKYCI